MNVLTNYLNSKKVKEVLSKRPGDEGFSLIELVVVIAVLAILAAVAIPAFNGIQMDARASAAKSGMANGIKECLVLEARGKSGTGLAWAEAKAFQGDYNNYTLSAWSAQSGTTCMGVKAEPSTLYEDTLPKLYMAVDGQGEVTKGCAAGTGGVVYYQSSTSDWSTNPGDPWGSYCW